MIYLKIREGNTRDLFQLAQEKKESMETLVNEILEGFFKDVRAIKKNRTQHVNVDVDVGGYGLLRCSCCGELYPANTRYFPRLHSEWCWHPRQGNPREMCRDCVYWLG